MKQKYLELHHLQMIEENDLLKQKVAKLEGINEYLMETNEEYYKTIQEYRQEFGNLQEQLDRDNGWIDEPKMKRSL